MQGIPLDIVSRLRASTSKQLIVAGGIASSEQIDELNALRIDAVVGMAIYTGRLNQAIQLLGTIQTKLKND